MISSTVVVCVSGVTDCGARASPVPRRSRSTGAQRVVRSVRVSFPSPLLRGHFAEKRPQRTDLQILKTSGASVQKRQHSPHLLFLSLPRATAAPPSPPTHSAATTALLPRIDGHSELRRRLLHLLAADPVLGGLAVAVIVAAAPAGRRRVQPPPATFR